MYITRVEIQNIRSIKHLVWEIDAANAPGWHVILGDNGSGKSSFVKSVALALISGRLAEVLRQDWSSWIRFKSDTGRIKLNINIDNVMDIGELSDRERARFQVSGSDNSQVLSPYIAVVRSRRRHYNEKSGEVENHVDMIGSEYLGDDSSELIYYNKFAGFSSSFGPFRRFTGGDIDEQKLLEANLRYTRHLSAFSERIALTESLKWLQQLRFKSLEQDNSAKLLLDNIIRFVNQSDFLPYDAQLTEITSSGVRFRDGNRSEILVEEMSDGYRSILSLTFELLRQLSVAYGPDIFETHPDGKVTVKVPGVVQIDEVDAHLHPTWQKQIGFWFREHFPAMQFIVTTHSPLVCQAAEKGSIFLLPRPGTDETGQMLEGTERDRLLYGDILDAYSTDAFGGGETRSPRGQEMLDRLGDLNVKELTEGLTSEEQKEQQRLRAALPTSATTLPKLP